MNGLAIVSVFDKTGLDSFVKGLAELGLGILSTGGTAKYLKENSIEVRSISDYTGHPEILDGRVKTLHPKVHGGILARRNLEGDIAQLKENEITPIDFVVVNLYPFIHKVREIEAAGTVDHERLVESIDIGGPTMIRAAAKNAEFVVPVCDPSDYQPILDELKSSGKVSSETRQRLAAKVFTMMSSYDGAIARYYSLGEKLLDEDGKPKCLAPVESYTLIEQQALRYGENPHQSAGLYRQFSWSDGDTSSWWEQLQGKEISYNNLLDMQGALDVFLELYDGLKDEHAAVVIKHSNPCGAAIRPTGLEAFTVARDCDPISAFGGIIAISGVVDADIANSVLEGFVEVMLVEELTDEAAAIFAKKKNVRVLKCDFKQYLEQRKRGGLSIRNSFGDYLIQTTDSRINLPTVENVVSGESPDEQLMKDAIFAWKVCKHVKSNAIIIVKDSAAIGIGAGQMSRVDAAKLAIQRAKFHGHDPKGGVSASDAFLPFSDTLEILNDAGVTSLVQPGGSIKDKDVIASAESRGVTMILTGERHFRH